MKPALRRIFAFVLAPAACLALACTPAREPLSLILIGLDTFRADHLGAYGHPDIQTPNIDALAAESVLFERCSATAPWTLPSFGSIFTGLYPYNHGAVGGPSDRLSDERTTLTEILVENGFETRAYTAVSYLGHDFGLVQGFQEHFPHVGSPPSRRLHLYRDHLLEYARRAPEESFFLFVHYFDAHAPYLPPEPFANMYYEGDPRASDRPTLEFLDEPDPRATPGRNTKALYGWLEQVTDLQYPVRQYAAAVSHVDHFVGELIEELRASGALDRSVLVLVGDHGEHLTEHGVYFTHSLPYDECLRVPLLVRLPDAAHGGRRIRDEVSQIDVMPTILELLGLPAREGLDGISLASSIRRGKRPPSRILFAEKGGRLGTHFVKAAWNGEHKLLVYDISGTPRRELYDRVHDPMELHDIADTNPGIVHQLEEAMWTEFDPASPITRHSQGEAAELDETTRERLRGLGYAH